MWSSAGLVSRINSSFRHLKTISGSYREKFNKVTGVPVLVTYTVGIAEFSSLTGFSIVVKNINVIGVTASRPALVPGMIG